MSTTSSSSSSSSRSTTPPPDDRESEPVAEIVIAQTEKAERATRDGELRQALTHYTRAIESLERELGLIAEGGALGLPLGGARVPAVRAARAMLERVVQAARIAGRIADEVEALERGGAASAAALPPASVSSTVVGVAAGVTSPSAAVASDRGVALVSIGPIGACRLRAPPPPSAIWPLSIGAARFHMAVDWMQFARKR